MCLHVCFCVHACSHVQYVCVHMRTGLCVDLCLSARVHVFIPQNVSLRLIALVRGLKGYTITLFTVAGMSGGDSHNAERQLPSA